MSMFEERLGREWAAETCVIASKELFRFADGYDRLIAKLEAGKVGKPVAYVRGVQKVIDSVKAGVAKLNKSARKIVQPPGLNVDRAFVDEHRET